MDSTTSKDGTEVIESRVTAVEPYSEIREQLHELRIKNESVAFDYHDPKGEKMARSHIHAMRGVKGAVERKRKELKAEALEYGRRIDAGAKQIAAELDDMIAVHQGPLDEIAERERQRVEAIEKAIAAITEASDPLAAKQEPTAREIAAVIEAVKAIGISADVYQERMAEATKLRDGELVALTEWHERQVKREAERAELERLRREAEEKARREREEAIAKAAAEKAKREAEEKAERDRIAAEQKAKAEREAAERREAALKEAEARAKREAEEAREKAKRDIAEAEARAKADAERREREAKAKAEREAAAIREAEAKREADKRHVAGVKAKAVAAIVAIGGIEKTTATAVVEAITAGNVPSVSIRF